MGLFEKIAIAFIGIVLTFIAGLLMRSINRADKKRDKESDCLDNLCKEQIKTNIHLEHITESMRKMGATQAEQNIKVSEMGYKLNEVVGRTDNLEKTVIGIVNKLNT